MNTYKKRLLARVCALCSDVLNRRIALVRTQGRVSDTARTSAGELYGGYDRLTRLDPFPDEGTLDESPLDALQTALADADGGPEEREQLIMNWLRNAAPTPATDDTQPAAAPEISPANQRMLDATQRLRSAIDRTRVRLLTTDRYDRAAYKAARNDFTLARAVFDQRLRQQTTDVSAEDTARAEGPLHDAISKATGASFPDDIQAAADFMRERIFIVA